MKLMKLDEILSQVRAARSIVRDATISALYHGCIHGNISWAKGMTREDVSAFDKAMRVFMPLKWEGKDDEGDKGQYIFSREKADTFCAARGEDGKADKNAAPRFTEATTWEEFYPVMLAEWNKANARKPKAEPVTQTSEQIREVWDKKFANFVKQMKAADPTLSIEELVRRLTTRMV